MQMDVHLFVHLTLKVTYKPQVSPESVCDVSAQITPWVFDYTMF